MARKPAHPKALKAPTRPVFERPALLLLLAVALSLPTAAAEAAQVAPGRMAQQAGAPRAMAAAIAEAVRSLMVDSVRIARSDDAPDKPAARALRPSGLAPVRLSALLSERPDLVALPPPAC